MNLIRKKIESKNYMMYYTADTYNGRIDIIIVDSHGKAITAWMDEEPIINNGKYLLKYSTLDDLPDGITKTRAQYLMLPILSKKNKMNIHFFPVTAISKSIMFEQWESITSKKLNGKFFEIPIEWFQDLSGAKRI